MNFVFKMMDLYGNGQSSIGLTSVVYIKIEDSSIGNEDSSMILQHKMILPLKTMISVLHYKEDPNKKVNS